MLDTLIQSSWEICKVGIIAPILLRIREDPIVRGLKAGKGLNRV